MADQNLKEERDEAAEKKRDPKKDAEEAFKRLGILKGKRALFDTLWQQLADYFLPNKNVILRVGSEGENKYIRLYDSTGAQANELLAGALHSMLTNPSSYWFEFTTGDKDLDDDDDVRKWLQDTAHVAHELMNNSNFQTEIHELYLDEGTFGIGAMSIEEDKETVIRFSAKPIKNCWVEENNKGFIDTVFYSYMWKPRLILQEFQDKAPAWVEEAAEKNPDNEYELLQVIEPNQEYDPGKKLSIQGKKYRSCTYLKGTEANDFATLEERGFSTWPWVTPRWAKATGETYGRSPAMKCLPEVKMINEMMRELIRAQQKATNPPLLVPDDGIVGSLKLTPGGINYYRSGSGDFIKPLESGANLQLSYEMMDDVRKRIRDSFYIDQLQLQEGPQMTATEVMQRTEEKIRLLGPLLGRQHSELLRPLIERVYEIMNRRGLVPKIPAKLSGKKIDVKYRSMLAKAQLQSEAQNIIRAIQTAEPFLNLDPNSKDVIDCDGGVKFAAELYGLPEKLIRDKKAIQDIRTARDQANQAMLQQQQQQQQAEQLAKVAPAVKMAHEMGQGSPAK